DFDTVGYPGRPLRIENAFTRSSQGVQYPMRELNFGEFHLLEYPRNKNSYPIGYYYNPKYPLGEVKFYPIPSSNYTVHFDIWFGFGDFANGSDVVELPIGYKRLLTYQLAVEMCPHIGKTPPQDVYRTYKKIESDLGAINNTLWMPSQKGAENNLNSNWFYMERGI
ncbi:MAG: hypothetical protein R3243_15955, partial [Arenibacter latericius]|nr:hypothetical protein [Arenibacter latericius]